jgi:N-acetylated-alpha-linked acidic dipeptidase
VTARQFLELFQRELGIKPPKVEPIFDAGSRESQHAIRSLTAKHHHQHTRSAWIDTYYPVLNTGVKQQLQILGKDGKPVWEANLEEIADMSDPGESSDFSADKEST